MLKNTLSKQFLKWILLLSVLTLGCSVLLILLQNYTFSSYQDTTERINEKYSYVETIDTTTNQALLDISRFVNSGDISYLELQEEYEQTIDTTINNLREMSTTAADNSYIENISAYYEYYFDGMLPVTASSIQEMQLEEAENLVSSAAFNEQLNEIRYVSLQYRGHLDMQTNQATNTFNQHTQLINFSVFAYILLSLAAFFIIFRLVLKRIGLPLEELAVAADKVSSGERNIHIRELHREDELGVLSTAFQRMIGKIKESEKTGARLNKELTEKNKELEQIVYIASHDLRSPLINIQGFNKELQASFAEIQEALETEQDVGAVKEKLADVMEEDIPEAFHYIGSSTDKMDLLLNALLRLSRIGREVPDMQPLDMNPLVANVVKNYEYRLSEEEVSLEIGELPQGVGDISLMDQVVSNLFANALKFMHPDRPSHIKVFGYESEGEAVYCIEDNGIGISDQYQQQIFKLFEKIDPYKEGEGLGLTIVRKILDRHDGNIWIESEIDQYSRIYFSLPKSAI